MEICFLETAVESGLSKKPAEGEVSSTSPSFLLPKKRKIKRGVNQVNATQAKSPRVNFT